MPFQVMPSALLSDVFIIKGVSKTQKALYIEAQFAGAWALHKSKMPRARPVEFSRLLLIRNVHHLLDATGLPRGIFNSTVQARGTLDFCAKRRCMEIHIMSFKLGIYYSPRRSYYSPSPRCSPLTLTDINIREAAIKEPIHEQIEINSLSKIEG
jgi:hypothetical protein